MVAEHQQAHLAWLTRDVLRAFDPGAGIAPAAMDVHSLLEGGLAPAQALSGRALVFVISTDVDEGRTIIFLGEARTMTFVGLFTANQPIAHGSFSQQMARLGRVGLQLVAQVSHVDAQVMALVRVRRPPDLAQ